MATTVELVQTPWYKKRVFLGIVGVTAIVGAALLWKHMQKQQLRRAAFATVNP